MWLWAMTEWFFNLSLVTFLLLSLTAHVRTSKLWLDIIMHLLDVMWMGLESLMWFKLMSACLPTKETFVCGYKTPQDLKSSLKIFENLSKLCTSGSLLFIIFDSVGECVEHFLEGSYAFFFFFPWMFLQVSISNQTLWYISLYSLFSFYVWIS